MILCLDQTCRFVLDRLDTLWWQESQHIPRSVHSRVQSIGIRPETCSGCRPSVKISRSILAFGSASAERGESMEMVRVLRTRSGWTSERDPISSGIFRCASLDCLLCELVILRPNKVLTSFRAAQQESRRALYTQLEAFSYIENSSLAII